MDAIFTGIVFFTRGCFHRDGQNPVCSSFLPGGDLIRKNCLASIPGNP
jgi:hypothetical protein